MNNMNPLNPDETFFDAWRVYVENIYKGQNLSKLQYDETKQAFYAGAFTVLTMMEKISVNSKCNTDIRKSIDKMHTEIVHYLKERKTVFNSGF